VYVANSISNTVSVIDAKQDKVVANVTVDKSPNGIAIDSNTGKVYVANLNSDTVSVIANTTTK
jgi:YVTN family beta-propeller protein